MESYEQRRRRLFGKLYLEKYNKMLDQLVPNYGDKKELISIVESDQIVENSRKLHPLLKKHFPFLKRKEWKEFIFRNIQFDSPGYFVFISYSRDCGALKLHSLSDLNFNFAIDFDPNGLITLLHHSLKEKIMLDFGEEDEGPEMEVVIYRE